MSSTKKSKANNYKNQQMHVTQLQVTQYMKFLRISEPEGHLQGIQNAKALHFGFFLR
jgi:hypothetical protein